MIACCLFDSCKILSCMGCEESVKKKCSPSPKSTSIVQEKKNPGLNPSSGILSQNSLGIFERDVFQGLVERCKGTSSIQEEKIMLSESVKFSLSEGESVVVFESNQVSKEELSTPPSIIVSNSSSNKTNESYSVFELSRYNNTSSDCSISVLSESPLAIQHHISSGITLSMDDITPPPSIIVETFDGIKDEYEIVSLTVNNGSNIQL